MHFVIMHQDRDASRRLAIIVYVNEIVTDGAQRMMCSRQFYSIHKEWTVFILFLTYLFGIYTIKK